MGATFEYRRFDDLPRSEVKKRFIEEQKEAEIEYGTDPYNGTISTLYWGVDFRYSHRQFDSFKDACEFLEDKVEKRETALAVKYKEQDKTNWLVGGLCAC